MNKPLSLVKYSYALELRWPWDLADFSSPQPYIGFQVRHDKSHPLRLGSFEGLVQLRHGPGREGRAFLDYALASCSRSC